MNQRLGVWPAIVALIASMVVLSVRSAEAQTNLATQQFMVPVQGTVDGATNTLSGSFTVNRFDLQNGRLVAVGTMTATVLDGAGNNLRTIVRSIALPVVTATGTCQVLHLELGPIDLGLLGMQLHLNQIVLDFTALSGSNNLVGRLLCSISSLLGSNMIDQQLTNQMNGLLGALAKV
jgi:hypothetical protein